MTNIYICEKCGKEGVVHEFRITSMKRRPTKYICKDCIRTQGMTKDEKEVYFKKKEFYIHKKIREMYEQKFVSYSHYANKLTVDDYPIKHPDGSLIVKCTYCGKPFRPTFDAIKNRIAAIDGMIGGECRLYCSEYCKSACPTFNRESWPAGFKKATSREVQPELRQLRLEMDNYECQKCGIKIGQAELHCHHITGIQQNPIESADIDNTITLCKKCHKWVHSHKGCHYFDMRCKST